MRRLPLLPLALALGGCPYVDSGELRVVRGDMPPLTAGATVELALYCDGLWDGPALTAGDGRCGHDWRVDGVVGGSATLGIVTDCGIYTAPVAPPQGVTQVSISASECGYGGECADACSAVRVVELAP